MLSGRKAPSPLFPTSITQAKCRRGTRSSLLPPYSALEELASSVLPSPGQIQSNGECPGRVILGLELGPNYTLPSYPNALCMCEYTCVT